MRAREEERNGDRETHKDRDTEIDERRGRQREQDRETDRDRDRERGRERERERKRERIYTQITTNNETYTRRTNIQKKNRIEKDLPSENLFSNFDSIVSTAQTKDEIQNKSDIKWTLQPDVYGTGMAGLALRFQLYL